MDQIGMTLEEWRERALKQVDHQRAATILKGSSEIKWSDLDHAHGDARDVPSMLRALLTEDEVAVDAVWQEVCETVCHSGSIYSSTIATIPFLQRMLAHGKVPLQHHVLHFLFMCVRSILPKQIIATSGGYYEQQRWLWSLYYGRDYDTDMRHQQDVEQKLYAAIIAGKPLYEKFLNHSNDELRETTRELMSFLETHTYE